MANSVSDIDINKISSLVYIGVKDNEESGADGQPDSGTLTEEGYMIKRFLQVIIKFYRNSLISLRKQVS